MSVCYSSLVEAYSLYNIHFIFFMWVSVSAVKLFSLRQYIKHVQLIRCRSVSAHALLRPISSDSELEESGLNSKQKDQIDCGSLELTTSGVVDKLYSLRKEPKIALSYFEQLKGSGFSHNVNTYASIVRILCSCGWDKRLDSVLLEIVRKENVRSFEVTNLLEALCEEGSTLFAHVSDAMIKAYASVGMFDEVIDMLFYTNRRGYSWSIMSCNFFMNKLVECEKVDVALAFYQQLKRLGLSLNEYTYVIIIKALCKKGSLEEAVELFLEMEKAGVTPNAFAYSTCIEGLCLNGMLEVGYDLLLKCREDNIPLNAFAYTIVIRGFCDKNKLEEAEGVLRLMEKEGVVPDAYAYRALISGYCKFGNINKTLEFHGEMISKGIKTNCVIVCVILNCLCQMGMASEAIIKFKEFRDMGVFLDKVCYNVIMDALCKLEKVEEAMELFNEMKGKQIVPDDVNYKTMIYGCCLQGKLGDVVNLFEEMKEMGYKPDIDAHNMIIEGLCVGGKVKEAEAFLSCLKEKYSENFSAMVNGYCEADLTEKAFQLFTRLSERRVLLTKGSCYKLLANLLMQGDSTKALILLKTMLALVTEPSKNMYHKLIGALCRAGEMKLAQWVFDDLIHKGLTPDLVTYTMLIHCYCKENCLQEACDIFNDMKQRGIKPDVVLYTVLFDAHSKIDLKSSSMHASVFWKEMKEMEIKPDGVLFTVLISRLCKANNLQAAIGVFYEMIDRGLEPDTLTYTTLLRGFKGKGDVDLSLSLDKMSLEGIQADNYTMSSVERGAGKARRLQCWHRAVCSV